MPFSRAWNALNKAGVTIALHHALHGRGGTRLCHRVAIMDRGRLIALDTPSGLTRSVGEGSLLIRVCRGVDDVFVRRLEQLGKVKITNLERSKVRLETGIQGESPQRVGRVGRESGAHIKTVNILEPDLEAVFLHLTGKHLRDASGRRD